MAQIVMCVVVCGAVCLGLVCAFFRGCRGNSDGYGSAGARANIDRAKGQADRLSDSLDDSQERIGRIESGIIGAENGIERAEGSLDDALELTDRGIDILARARERTNDQDMD